MENERNAEHELILALTNAVEEPESNVISNLLGKCSDLNSAKEEILRDSALHIAAGRNYLNSARILLDAKASVNIQNLMGRTPLHISCRIELGTQMVVQLLQFGADVNVGDNHGRTPLHVAAFHQRIDTIHELLKHKAKVNAVDWFDNTSMLYALQNYTTKIKTVEVLLKAGADVNHRNRKGQAPLHFAVGRNSLEIVHLLIKNKCEVNVRDDQGNSPLYWATRREPSPIEVIKELVRGGADLNAVNSRGHSALYCSMKLYDSETTRDLLRCGANVEFIKYKEYLEIPFIEANFKHRINDISAILKDLIIYLFIQDPDCYTSIRRQLMHTRVVELLRIWSHPQCNLKNVKNSCLSEVYKMSNVVCDCGESSVWGSITGNEACICDNADAIVKFLLSGRRSNFTDAFFHKLSKNFLLTTLLNQISFFEFQKLKKRVMLNEDCVKAMESYVTFEDVQFALQREESVMDAEKFNQFRAFVKGEPSSKSSSKVLPCPSSSTS